jgi:hypothetical protein
MLLSGYRKEIFRPECNHWFQSLHRLAPLQDQLPGVRPANLYGFRCSVGGRRQRVG